MWTPSTALTTLAALATLVTLGAGAPEKNSTLSLLYEVILHKGVLDSELDVSRGPYIIPDGQCTGVLDTELTCLYSRVKDAMRITVQDGAPYPVVGIANSMQSATVVRSPPCKGVAVVNARLACS